MSRQAHAIAAAALLAAAAALAPASSLAQEARPNAQCQITVQPQPMEPPFGYGPYAFAPMQPPLTLSGPFAGSPLLPLDPMDCLRMAPMPPRQFQLPLPPAEMRLQPMMMGMVLQPRPPRAPARGPSMR